MQKDLKFRLAIFASGGGSNAEKILIHFANHDFISVDLILYNRKDAGVQRFGDKFGLPAVYWSNASMKDESATKAMLSFYKITGVILAGYLALIPPYMIELFPERILNIHPALLPAFGGHGMYGHYVHEAVSRSGADKSGITIHLVNNEYDRGRILFQHSIPILPYQDPEIIQKAVLAVEHSYYAPTIEAYFSGLLPLKNNP